MHKMSAAVRITDTGETTTITSEYPTKAAFKKDLQANGYTVIGRIAVEGDRSAKTRRYEKGCKA